MHGVGPGTVLGGRYTTQHRREQRYGAERWSAHDSTLERDVTVLCLDGAGPQAAAVLDAARRVAALDNSVLVRVLDVGRDEAVAYVVEEDLTGTHTLSSLLSSGGLPSEEVRRIVGETASCLEAARQRGLHHLDLSAESVLRTHDGAIKVLGVATSAVLSGHDLTESDEASRQDAVGVVALTYAGLTGSWPLPGDSAGLPHAARVVGGLAAPSEIAAGVPADLNALCRLTLNDDQGPTTPGDFARQVAPWSRQPVEGVGRLRPHPSATSPAPPQAATSAPTSEIELVAPAPPTLSSDPTAPSEPASTTEPTMVIERPAAPPTGDNTLPADQVEATPPPAEGAPGATSGEGAPASGAATGAGAGAAVGAAVAGVASSVGATLGSAGQATGSALGGVSERVGAFRRSTSERAADRRALRAEAERHAEQVPLGETLTSPAGAIEPPAPLLPDSLAQPLSRQASKLALGIVAVCLILALAVGIWGVSRIGSHSNLGLGSSPAETSSSAPTTSTSATVAPSGQPLAILSATGFDPQGDGAESNSQAGHVYDGNPATIWSSEGYQTASFGGLKKGVGVILDFGQSVQPKTVTVIFPTSEGATLYLSDDRSLDNATAIGTVNAKGTTTVAVPPTAKGQYLIVWFTKITQSSDGRYRATLAEVSVKG